MARRRNTYRKPPIIFTKRKANPSRVAFSFFLFLGMTVVGSVLFYTFLTPEETLSSIDLSAMGVAARHEYTDPAENQFSGDNPYETENEANQEPQELPVAEAPREPEITRMTDIIKSGDTPSSLLEGHLGMAEIYSLCNESKDVYPLNNLKAGQPWTMIYSGDALVGLEYEIDSSERLVVSMTDTGYEFKREPIPYETEVKTVTGVIDSSLFGAVTQTGENEELALRMANVFAYDVDFTRDLRSGDSFTVVIEKKSREGNYVGYGNLMAASFTNQGQTYYAYRYTNKKGYSAYYDQNGRPLRKAFLKSPLPFTRISSGYSMNRLHPILGYRRPHQGIDYAAPSGTPISSVADGVVVQAASNNSQGRFVRVIHSNGYETIYNHMSRFAKNTKKGARVKQGGIIGYVGQTGYATGPHLDFRMKHNGTLINPLKIKSMPADPISSKEMPSFKAAVAEYRDKLKDHVKSASLEAPQTKAQ